MDHYIEIRLLPDPEFAPPMLMSAVFAKLHRGLVEHGHGDIGVSFPDVDDKLATLGPRIRLHGTRDSLARLMHIPWLAGMRDHAAVGAIAPVPPSTRHRVVRRVQAQSNPERLRRRLMNRKGIDNASAREAIPESAAERVHLPHVSLASRSTNQRFRLFIAHQPPQDSPNSGRFTTYGLSASATIPWF